MAVSTNWGSISRVKSCHCCVYTRAPDFCKLPCGRHMPSLVTGYKACVYGVLTIAPVAAERDDTSFQTSRRKPLEGTTDSRPLGDDEVFVLADALGDIMKTTHDGPIL